MQLTRFTDYTLRTLMFLSAHPGEIVSTATIGEAHGISTDHVAKAAKWLTQQGYVESKRGLGGGIRLACDPARVRIGALVRQTEPNLNLLECFDEATNTCVLHRACRLESALRRAQRAFLAELDAITLADLVVNAPELVVLLGRRQRGA